MTGFITAEGIVIPAGSDTYDYVNDQRRFAASVRSIVPVAFDGAFSTVVSGMATDGRPVSDTNPLFAWNANDKGLQYQGTAGVMLPLGPAVPFGHMGRTAGFQTLTPSAQTVGMAAAQVLLNGMTFDATHNALKVPVTGYYRITQRCYAIGGTAWCLNSYPNINGTANSGAGISLWKADSQDYYSGASIIRLLNANDYVNITAYASSGTPGSTWGTTGNDGVWLELEWVQGA